MKKHDDLQQFSAINPVVTIGTFDGLHRGHQMVIKHLKKTAKKYGGQTVVFTFYPHPRIVTSPDESNLRLLTTREEKISLFGQLGIDHLVVFPFTKEFASLSYTQFVEEILVKKMKTRCLVVGYDHKFGKNREGGFEYLQKCGKKFGFEVEKMEALALDNDHVSSTRIRAALQEGNIKKANQFLGYNFIFNGTVVSGKQLGRKLGFPTANIEASDKYKLIPGYGVYAVQVEIKGNTYNGMLNIGTRPTFNKNADNRSIEVNIFDFSEDIYGQEITLVFFSKIRNEKKFKNVQGLVEQLKLDQLNAAKALPKL